MRRREFLAVAAAPALAAGPQFIKSICSVIFPPTTPLPECFKRAKEAGFDAIEIRMNEEVSLDSTPDQMKQLADDAHKAGVMIASMWVSRPLAQHPINSPDAAVRAQGVAALEKPIRLAKYANCAEFLIYPARLAPGPMLESRSQATRALVASS